MEVSDEFLMSKIKKDDPELLHRIYRRYSARIFAYFLKSTMVRDDSEDLTQELFLRILKYRRSYQEGQSVEIWIFQIARNLLKDYFNKMKVRRDRFPNIVEPPDESDLTDVRKAEQEVQLYQAMDGLSGEKREILVLSKFEGMKYEQIARLKQTSVSNIKVQVHRIIKELRDIYFKKEEIKS